MVTVQCMINVILTCNCPVCVLIPLQLPLLLAVELDVSRHAILLLSLAIIYF